MKKITIALTEQQFGVIQMQADKLGAAVAETIVGILGERLEFSDIDEDEAQKMIADGIDEFARSGCDIDYALKETRARWRREKDAEKIVPFELSAG